MHNFSTRIGTTFKIRSQPLDGIDFEDSQSFGIDLALVLLFDSHLLFVALDMGILKIVSSISSIEV